jgi:hypothetical protein
MVTGTSAPSGDPSNSGTPGAVYMGRITLTLIDPWEDPANQPLFPEAVQEAVEEDSPTFITNKIPFDVGNNTWPIRIWRYKKPGDPGYKG